MNTRSMLRLAALAFPLAAGAQSTLTVPSAQFNGKTAICDAITAAQPGDIIEVSPAASGSTYNGQHCSWSTDNLTLRGVNGRPSIDAMGSESNVAARKAIFATTAPDFTLENFELAGAFVVDDDGANGAGLRFQGLNLTVRGCYFHDNQDGILSGPLDAEGNPANGNGEILIEDSEFYRNGVSDPSLTHGYGYTHNMYVGASAKFTLRGSYTHASNIGHLVKSRAYVNLIEVNWILDEDGTTSYEIDLPQGGESFILGNVIEQSASGASSGNPIVVSYAEENQNNPLQTLYLVNNTILNDASGGTFVAAPASPTGAMINNLFRGPGTLLAGATLMQMTNWTDAQGDPKLGDPISSSGHFDYLLQAGSPLIGAGSDPGTADGQPLTPTLEYAPLPSAPGYLTRPAASPLDIGAYAAAAPVLDAGSDAGMSADAGEDAGVTADAGSSDAGTDAGVTADAGTDAGTGHDAGTGGPAPTSSSGCQSAPVSTLAFLLLIPLLRRRRSAKPS